MSVKSWNPKMDAPMDRELIEKLMQYLQPIHREVDQRISPATILAAAYLRMEIQRNREKFLMMNRQEKRKAMRSHRLKGKHRVPARPQKQSAQPMLQTKQSRNLRAGNRRQGIRTAH